MLSGKFLGFFTFIFFEILSTSKFWISLKLCPDSFIIFSINVINGAVLSTVARSEVLLLETYLLELLREEMN